MVAMFEDRPPYATFETRAEEDRDASIAAGHYVARDVDYAIITPMGSKDKIERPVAEWFAKLKQDVAEQRFPREWFKAYESIYADWKADRATPVSGTAVENWPAASPAQVKTMLGVGVRTVEDLAGANEETLGRLGMGGRALKQRAVEWLASANSSGKQAEEMAALRAANEDLSQRNAALETQLKELAAKVEALTPVAKKL